MDSFETPYEEDSESIECTVCQKSIRGDTLYKFHLTSPGHLKKEESLVAKGLLVRERDVPKFKDILHYLDYMKLDEPIIGLNYVEEVSVDSRNEPQYTCLLCRQNARLTEMVRHLIGRKHRQKYLETKRPDLVTWDKQSQATQSGKVIRARAEIVERQDGRGRPVMLPVKKRSKPNCAAKSEPALPLPRLMDLTVDPTVPNGRPSARGNTPPVRLKDSYVPSRDMRDENPVSCDRYVGDLQRADYRDSDVERGKRDYREPEFQRDVKEFVRNEFELRAESSVVKAQHGDSLYGRPYTERGQIKEFYSNDIRGEQIRPAEYQSPERPYPEADGHRQSLDRELFRQVSSNRSGRLGTNEPESSYRDFPSAAQGDQPFGTKVAIQDYGHKSKELHQEGYCGDAGPSGRTGVSISHRQTEVSRCMADIPEPFKRFLSGPTVNTDQAKRKRKSRFSDASAEEIERAKTIFEEYGPPKPKLADCTQPARQLVSRRTESFQKGGSESGTVFDLLSNIEIDNVEEADFLKNKLCDLLKEFKAKKMEKAGQPKLQSQETLVKEYNNLSAALDPPPAPQYERQYNSFCAAVDPPAAPQYERQYNKFSATVDPPPAPQYERQYNKFSATVDPAPAPQYERQYSKFSATVDSPPKPLYERQRLDDLDSTLPVDNIEIQDDSRERGWKHPNDMPERPRQEFLFPVRDKVEHASPTRRLYEEVIGRRNMAALSRGYSESLEEPFQTRDYRPTAVDYVDIRSPVPRPNTPQERVLRYPNNLEKITSTLLELVEDPRFKLKFPNL